MNPTARVTLEQAVNDEAKAVLGELQRIERSHLTPDERSRALVALKLGLQNYRAERRAWHEGQLARLREKHERETDRRAAAEAVRLQRLRQKVEAMSTDEVTRRAEELLGAESPNGDEVDLLSARLRQVTGTEPLRSELRDIAGARRAWEPWAQEGEGAEHAAAVDEIDASQVGYVTIDFEGERLNAPVDDLLDAEGALDQVK